MKVKVNYDEKGGKFHVACPFHLNDVVRGLPNRRFDSKKKYWVVPAIRANVIHINDKFTDDIVEFAPGVIDVIKGKIASYTKKAADHGPKFPAWYPFKTKCRPKQLDGLNKVYGNKAFALFMDMRTGKTKVIIDCYSALRMEGKVDRVLIISPLSIRKNWVRELAVHCPFPVDHHLLDTSKPKEFERWLHTPHDFKWLLVGIESLAAGSAIQLCEKFLLSSVTSATVVDESSKIKNHSAVRSTNCVKLGRMSEYRALMTGTPTTKGPLDLFMQFEFLDPDIIGMGDFYSFRARYAEMGGYENKEVIGYCNIEELMELIEPYVYQVRKREVFPDDPDKVYIKREVSLSKAQIDLMRQIRNEKKIESGDKSLIIKNVLEKMLRLQEIAGGFVTFDTPEEERERLGPKSPKYTRESIPGPNPKLSELLDCTEEYDGPTIVWCAFKDEIRIVADALRKKYGAGEVVELHGGIDEATRDLNVNVLFQGGKAKYLVGNAATGGMGLTMSKAEIEIYYSNTFNFIDREQSEERSFGPDKQKGTVVIDIIAENTIDEVIVEALENKKDVSEYIRDSITEIKKRYAL